MKKLFTAIFLLVISHSGFSQTIRRDTIPFRFRMEVRYKGDVVEHHKWYKVVVTYKNLDSAGFKISGTRVLCYLDSLKREVPTVDRKRKWTIE